jgi:hypothetical protein
MTTRHSIGGLLDANALAMLTSKPPPATALETPLHVRQVADARRSVQVATAALRYLDTSALSASTFADLQRVADVLREQANALHFIEQAMREGQR